MKNRCFLCKINGTLMTIRIFNEKIFEKELNEIFEKLEKIKTNKQLEQFDKVKKKRKSVRHSLKENI